MSLALIDRYLAINHPVWYRQKMTVRLASVLVILSSAFVALLIKFVYILGLGAPSCQMWNVHTKTLTVVLFILFSICTALNLIVYRQTPKFTSRMVITSEGEDIDWVELDDLGIESRSQTTSTIDSLVDYLSQSIQSTPMIHLDVNRRSDERNGDQSHSNFDYRGDLFRCNGLRERRFGFQFFRLSNYYWPVAVRQSDVDGPTRWRTESHSRVLRFTHFPDRKRRAKENVVMQN
jgi:hypothetical protein